MGHIRRSGFAVIAMWYALVLVGMPLMAGADEAVTPAVPTPTSGPVLITEVQTGTTASGAEEFIELYNATNSPIDFAANQWQLQIGNATATDWQSPYRTIPLTGSLAPGAYYLVASKSVVDGQTVQYLPTIAAAWFSAGISAEGAHLRLVYNVSQTQNGVCGAVSGQSDQVEWSSVDATGQALHASIDARKPFLAPAAGLAPDSGLQRFRTAAGVYIDTNSDNDDFAAAASTPGAHSTVVKEVAPPPPAAVLQDDCQVAPVPPPPSDAPPVGDVQPTTPSTPPSNSGLLAPQISELLPNPAAPQTDEADEFIELYNPNPSAFDLTGFTLDSGLNFNHSYRFLDGTQLPPLSFVAFYIKDTRLVLANSGSQARLSDAAGNVVDQAEAFGAALAGQAWILADHVWQWTTVPTPGLTNSVSPPPVKLPKTPAAKPAATAPKKPATPTTKKTTAVKAAKVTSPAKKIAETKPPTVAAATVVEPKSNPLHPGVLAAAAVLALLYGAYEYRHDMANFVRKFRQNRAARRAGG